MRNSVTWIRMDLQKAAWGNPEQLIYIQTQVTANENMTVGCSSTANRQAGKHTRGNRRTDALANAKDLQPRHPECEQLQSCGTRNIPDMKSYNHVEPEISRMWRATAVWRPNIPNANSYNHAEPQTSRMWRDTTMQNPNIKIYNHVEP